MYKLYLKMLGRSAHRADPHPESRVVVKSHNDAARLLVTFISWQTFFPFISLTI